MRTDPVRRHGGWKPRDLVAAALLAALFTAIHIRWSDPFGEDLMPAPDAMEYVASAESMLRHGLPAVALTDGALYPSRYAQGYPAALALWRWATGGGQTSALSFNLLMSALSVVLTYLVGRHFAGRAGAFAAGVLWALSPKPMDYAELIVCEPLLTALVLAITAVIVARAGRGGAASAFLVGFLSGYLCAVRVVSVLLLVYLLPLALLLRRRGRGRDLAWGLAGFLPWVIAIAALQAWLNGHVMRQGYDLWAPYATRLGDGWNWRYFLFSDFPLRIPQTPRPHWLTYPPMLLGLPPVGFFCIIFYSWPVAVGAIWRLWELGRRAMVQRCDGAMVKSHSRTLGLSDARTLRLRWALCLLAGLAVSFAIWSLYYYWDPRFFMPLMPLVLILGCGALIPRRREGWSGANLTRGTLLALALWHSAATSHFYITHQRPWAISERRALRALSGAMAPDALVVADTYGFFAESELGARRVMNWAIDGRDVLLYESRHYQVPPLTPPTRPPALFVARTIAPDASAEIASARAAGREAWLILHEPSLAQDLNQDRLRALESDGVRLTPADIPEAAVYRVWRWE